MLSAAGAAAIFISSRFISIDPSIKSLLPYSKKLDRALSLVELSPVAEKVIIYIEVNNRDRLEDAIDKIDGLVADSKIEFTNSIPSIDDINSLLAYTSRYSLILYPYETNGNPFTAGEITKRLRQKSDFLNSMVFYNPDSSFFMDPLMMGTEVLRLANRNASGKYTPYRGGVLSASGKAFIKILNSGIKPDDYNNMKKILTLDKKIVQASRENGFRSFLYGSHLYFNESFTTIIRDVNIIFILSIVLVILIFHFFFRRIMLSFYSFIPILLGFAVTFVFIAIFKNQFGGIALAFGGTTTGISIDYTINYLARLNRYPTLGEIRRDIGFSLILGFLTTIACFVFLLFSSIMSLIEIAVFGILSVGFSFVFSYFVLQRLVPPGSFESDLRKIDFPLLGVKGFVVWVIVMALFFGSVPFLKFEDNIYKLDMNHKELNRRLGLIKSSFDESTDNIFLVFEGQTRDEALDKSLKALQLVRKQSADLNFLTPAIFIPPKDVIEMRKNFVKRNFNRKIFTDKLKNSDFSSDAFDNWLETIQNIESFNIKNVPNYIKNEVLKMIITKNDKTYLMIQIPDRKKSESISKILTAQGIDFFTMDIMKDGRDSLVKFEKDALSLLILSIIIVILILLIAYRDAVFAFTSVLPGIAGLLAALGVAVLTMGKFNIMHVVSCILIMGIGVDYGIFMTSAYRQGYSEDNIKLTIRSIFICALTTIAGFGTLSVSSNYSIFSMGSSILGGIIVAYLTFYLALPFILQKYCSKKK